TDPTFDPPGDAYGRPPATLTKTQGPALSPEAVGRIDAVLLSHDHHADNLDHAGRALLAQVGRVATTPAGAGRLRGGAVRLCPSRPRTAAGWTSRGRRPATARLGAIGGRSRASSWPSGTPRSGRCMSPATPSGMRAWRRWRRGSLSPSSC